MTGVHVRVDVGGEQYALPVERVQEVVEVGQLTPVPGTPEGVIGLRNLGGDIVPAVDLARILGVERERAPGRLVVVERTAGRTALAVDAVIDVGQLPGELAEHDSPYLLASTVIDGTMVGLLDLDVVLDSSSQEAAP